MKKNVQLDTKGFLLVETLLVSLTIASILIYMYVQYSKITDSYKRLNRYNTVEALYRTETIKQIILSNATENFYSNLKEAGYIAVDNYIDGVNVQLYNVLNDLDVNKIYLTSPGFNFYDNTSINQDGFTAFLSTVPEEEMDKYQIIVHYKGATDDDIGTFAIVSFTEPVS